MFLILNWNDIEEELDNNELEVFYSLLNKISGNKPEKEYLVLNGNEPWIDRVKELKKARDREPWMSKEELLKKLRKCTEIKDSEEAHIDAVVAILDYVNDAEIDDAFSDVPLWFMGDRDECEE